MLLVMLCTVETLTRWSLEIRISRAAQSVARKQNKKELCQIILIIPIFRPLKNIHIVFPIGQKISLSHFVDAIS